MFKRKERQVGKIKIVYSFFNDLTKGHTYEYYRSSGKMWVNTELGFEVNIADPAISHLIQYEIVK